MTKEQVEQTYASLVSFARSGFYGKMSAKEQRARFGFVLFGKKTIQPKTESDGSVWFDLYTTTLSGDYDVIGYNVRQCVKAIEDKIKLGRGCGISRDVMLNCEK